MKVGRTSLEERVAFSLEPVREEQKRTILSHLRYQPMVQLSEFTDEVVGLYPPRHAIRTALGREVYCSDLAVEPSSRRAWVVLYVRRASDSDTADPDSEERYHVVPAYQSSSHGLWRILPGVNYLGFRTKHYAKGLGEVSVTLPVAIQRAFSSLLSGGKVKKLRSGIKNKGKFAYRYSPRSEEGIESLAPSFKYFHGHYADSIGVDEITPSISPENVRVKRRFEPDFDRMIGPFKHNTARYGKIDLFVTTSKDNGVIWVFCREPQRGECWVGNIEGFSRINTAGVPMTYIEAPSELIKPPVDYFYSARTRLIYRKTGYSSRIPVVKKFVRRLRSMKN